MLSWGRQGQRARFASRDPYLDSDSAWEQDGRDAIGAAFAVAVATLKPRRDDTLIKALLRAHRWRRKIESGTPSRSPTSRNRRR
jgi:hypothetical protein